MLFHFKKIYCRLFKPCNTDVVIMIDGSSYRKDVVSSGGRGV